MDYESQRLPLVETVQLFGFSHHAAELAVNAIKARDSEIAEMIGNPMKINGVGKAKLCADLRATMIVLQQLPLTERVRVYRRKCADDLVRQMQGDLTLVDQIAHNHSVFHHTGGIHYYENSMGNVTAHHQNSAFPDIECEERRLALEERRSALEERRSAREERKAALVLAEKKFDFECSERSRQFEIEQKRFEMDMANQAVRRCIRVD